MPDDRTGGTFPEPRGGTEPLQPVPDRFFQKVYPYRGVENHGVDDGVQPWIPAEASEDTWQGEETYDPEIIPIKPIPVEIVNQSANERRAFRTVVHHIVKNRGVIIAGHNERINRVHLRNLALVADTTQIVWIGDSAAIVPGLSGYPLRPGESLTIEAEEAIYAILDDAAVVGYQTLAVLIELTVGGS